MPGLFMMRGKSLPFPPFVGPHGLHIVEVANGRINFVYTDASFFPGAWGFVGHRADGSEVSMGTGYITNTGANTLITFYSTNPGGPMVSVDAYSYTSTSGFGETAQGTYPLV